MVKIVKSLRNGQVTIPYQLRQRLGIVADSLLQISLEKDEIRIRPLKLAQKADEKEKNELWFGKLHERFSRVRAEAKKYGGKAVNDSISKAVKAVRSSHG